jgi:hypothetical protein
MGHGEILATRSYARAAMDSCVPQSQSFGWTRIRQGEEICYADQVGAILCVWPPR